MQLVSTLINSKEIKLLLIFIVLDTIFGVLRAIKEKTINSTIGIDGIIRKVGMVISILFFTLTDFITMINLIGFIPEGIREYIGIEMLGISSLFSILFIVFELLSIFKNMIKCKLPIPKKLQKKLEEIFKEFTGELDTDELHKHLNQIK